MNETVYDIVQSDTETRPSERVWKPTRTGGLANLQFDGEALDQRNQIQQIRLNPSVDVSQNGTVVSVSGVPEQVANVSATESPSKQQDRTFSLVSVSFTRDGNDTNFAGVRIWFIGYKGNTNPMLMTDGTDSPVSFLCESTGENVTVVVQAYGENGLNASFDDAPTTTVLLDGVVSAPPAPNVSQPLVGTIAGVQFTFDVLGSLLSDVVDTYKVYRNTVSNNPNTATVVQTYKHPQTNNGHIVFQDQVSNGLSYYYWVSAVNTAGLESALTSASTVASFAPIDPIGNLILKNKTTVNGITSSPTTTSGVGSTVPDMSLTITTQGNKVFLSAMILITCTASSSIQTFAINRDGVQITQPFEFNATISGARGTITITTIDFPSAASHTYEMIWSTTAGTATAIGTGRQLLAVELG
jgi:hypothetical protein